MKIPVSTNLETLAQLAALGVPLPEYWTQLNMPTNQTTIPAGYRVTITSWENDADNYKTTIHEGLTKPRVEYMIELCKLFVSQNRDKNAFGNMYDPSEHEVSKAVNAVRALMRKHQAVLTEDELQILDGTAGDEDDIRYNVQEMVSEYLDTGEDYAFRVFDGAKVELIPHEIKMEDVSSQFGV